MLQWLFQKRRSNATPALPFQYGESLTLDWNEDCEAWTCALPELGIEARISISPREGADHPKAESCAVVDQARKRILWLNDAALDFLVKESSAFVQDAFEHRLSSASFIPAGVEICESEDAPGEFSLVYDPVFDPGAVWRVNFNQNEPYAWRFDD